MSTLIKVLIVDDSKMIRLMVRQIFDADQDCQFKLHESEDGEKAIRYLCSCDSDELPDVILLDRNMPNMSGDECIRVLKFDQTWRLIPVLFLTAQGDKKEIVKGLTDLEADDYLPKPFDSGEMLARVKVLARIKRAEDRSRALNKDLAKANYFIRKTFGRYLSDEVVDTILESPDGLSLGGEKRLVTVMMTDLRGFTAIGERLSAETVVNIVNIYFEEMTEIILKYQGTINEFIGDAILATFGVPIQRENDAQRAVACAVEMQLAMNQVNARNRKAGYPEITMGIGINTGLVVAGNIGSSKRLTYSIMGRNVNLASRIESYTVGGQIFISETTLKACKSIVEIGNQIKVKPKGVKNVITITEVIGIKGNFNIFLPQSQVELTVLEKPIYVKICMLTDKDESLQSHEGIIERFIENVAEIQSTMEVEQLMNIKVSLIDSEDKTLGELYAKVTTILSVQKFRVVFTSISPEAQNYLEKSLKSQTKVSHLNLIQKVQ